jgi:hypothetical protein
MAGFHAMNIAKQTSHFKSSNYICVCFILKITSKGDRNYKDYESRHAFGTMNYVYGKRLFVMPTMIFEGTTIHMTGFIENDVLHMTEERGHDRELCGRISQRLVTVNSQK